MSYEKMPKTYEEFFKNLNNPITKTLTPLEGQLYLISTKDCQACDDAQVYFKEDIKDGKILVTTMEEEKGLNMIKALDLNAAPALVLEKLDGGFCLIDQTGAVDRCALPAEEKAVDVPPPDLDAEDCPECADAIGGAWSITVAKELNMPDVDGLEKQLLDGASGIDVLEKVLDYAKEIGDKEAEDYLLGIKQEMQ